MKILLCILFFASSTFTYCQCTLVEYEIMGIGGGNLSKCELIIFDSMAVWRSESDSLEHNFFFLKNYTENAIYYNDNVLNIKTNVKDTLSSMKWSLTEGATSILNEKCFAAKTFFRGRRFTAFYVNGNSIPEGPEKFGGLPGLILKVESDDGFIRFVATKIIKNYTGKVDIPKIINYKFITWGDYAKKIIDVVQNMMKLARSNGTLTDDAHAKFKFDNMEIIYPEAQLGDGISF